MALQKLLLSALRIPEKTDIPTDPRPIIRTAVVILATLALTLGVWIILVPMDGAVIASGLIRTQQSVWNVQPSVNGVVQRVAVADGERVKAGQTLVEIADPDRLAALQATRAFHDNEQARNARLVAEASFLPAVEFPAQLASRREKDAAIRKLLESENRIFQMRRTNLLQMTETLHKQEALLSREQENLDARVESQKQSSKLVGEQIESGRRLVEKGFFSRTRMLELERARAQDDAAVGELKADAIRVQQRAADVRFRQTEIRNNYVENANQELRRSSERLAQLQEQLNALNERFSSQAVASPGPGVVMNLKTTTTGLVVTAGQTIMEIVPESPEVIIEALVRAKDIRFVKRDSPVEVAVSAWNQRSAPLLRGTISYVAEDISRTPDKDSSPVYLTRVRLDPASIPKDDPDMPLRPGMQATVYVKTGSRTLLDYLAEPVIDSMRSAFKEP